jgi:hypothetical protein
MILHGKQVKAVPGLVSFFASQQQNKTNQKGILDSFNRLDVSSFITLMGMSTRLMIAMPNSLLTFESSKEGWKKKTHQFSEGTHPQCIAFDAGNSNCAYCGMFGNGLWKTDDGGQSWNSIGETGISSKDVMSVSVSSLERVFLDTWKQK